MSMDVAAGFTAELPKLRVARRDHPNPDLETAREAVDRCRGSDETVISNRGMERKSSGWSVVR